MDGTKVSVTPKNNTDFSVEELNEFVEGHFEFVRLSKSQLMVVNEEGKILGLPYNPWATMCCRMAGIKDVIVGNVLICNADQVR